MIFPNIEKPYNGSTASIWFLGFLFITTIFRGCAHLLAADFAAEKIGGLKIHVAGGENLVAIVS